MKTFILIILIFYSFASPQVVIANKDVTDSNIDISKLNNIFTLDIKNWEDGRRIVVFDSKSEELSNAFYSYIGLTTFQVRKIWLRKVLLGEIKAPAQVNNDDEMIEKVSQTSGAIGFVKEIKNPQKIKVLLRIKK